MEIRCTSKSNTRFQFNPSNYSRDHKKNILDKVYSSGLSKLQLTKKRCVRNYDTNCLKVDLISSLEKLGRSTDFQLLPGVKLVANTDLFLAQRSSDTKMEFSADNISQQLDELLKRRLVSYAKSLSLNIQIFDKDQKKGKSFGTSVFENLFRQSVEGRGNMFTIYF